MPKNHLSEVRIQAAAEKIDSWAWTEPDDRPEVGRRRELSRMLAHDALMAAENATYTEEHSTRRADQIDAGAKSIQHILSALTPLRGKELATMASRLAATVLLAADEAKPYKGSVLISTITQRLRGNYTFAVNDGAGLLDGKDTFTRAHTVAPIQQEAAAVIDSMAAVIFRISEGLDNPQETTSEALRHFDLGVMDDDLKKEVDEALERKANGSELRMAAIFRGDISMPTGKACAQAGHAFLSSWAQCEDRDMANAYMAEGQTKIVLIAHNVEHLMKIMERAKKRGVSAVLITDHGRTVFNEPTITVLGIGPCSKTNYNNLTRGLTRMGEEE